MKENKNILTFIGIIILCLTILFSMYQIGITYIANDNLDVNIQDYAGEIQSYFLMNVKQTTTLTTNAPIHNTTIDVISASNCIVGEAVNIYNDVKFFQAIITAVTPTSITFTPTLDTTFLVSNSFVECGAWNMAVNGAITPTYYTIHPPTNVSWHIESSVFSILDNAVMDSATFGSRTALTDGLVVSVMDGYAKELFLIYNNNGFNLRGYDLQYIEKAPSGVYGFNAHLYLDKTFGSIIELDGPTNDTLQVIIRDDLTSQQEVVMTAAGHITTD